MGAKFKQKELNIREELNNKYRVLSDIAGLNTNHGKASSGQTSSIDVVGGGSILRKDNIIWSQLGTPEIPDSTASYKYKAIHAEVNSNSVVPAISTWGNEQKAPAILGDFTAYDGFQGEGTGGAFRAYSDQDVTNADSYWLTGMAALGQTNTGSGNECFHVWGGNFVAAQTSGINAVNVVGIEVDVIHEQASSGQPGQGGTNFTGYWAQTDANGQYSNAAFFASRTTRASGWREVLMARVECANASIDVNNILNSTLAHGALIETRYENANTDIIRASSNGTERFSVNGDTSNPIWLMVGGTLKQVTVGAANSGGTGYKVLRVVN